MHDAAATSQPKSTNRGPSPFRRVMLNLDAPLVYLRAAAGGFRHRALFDGVQRYAMFIGHPRSGHSLVGSLLDAHPRMVIAHELDVLRYVWARFSRNQIFELIVEHDRKFTESGRAWTGYDYVVPGQWQGRFESLDVIGDKKGGVSTMRLMTRPWLLDRLKAKVGVPLRVIHVVRNPYDNIATIHRKDGLSLDDAVRFYFELYETNEQLERKLGDDALSFRHEQLVADPRSKLSDCCAHLGVDAPEDWLEACAGVVFDAPNKSRNRIEWPREAIDEVARRIDSIESLHGYTFDA